MLNKKVKLSKSGVPWTDYSWGVVDGCTKVSEACQNCYAEAMAKRFWANQIVQENKPSVGGELNPLERRRKFSDVQIHPEKLEAPLNAKKGGKVFVAPLGDLFHESVPFEFVDQVFAVMALCHQHTFQVLTKRPERMLEWFNYKDMAWRHESMRGDERIRFQTYHTFGQMVPSEVWQWPLKNVWLGVTAENQEQWDKRTVILSQIPAVVRFVSVEPMLGPVDSEKSFFKCHLCGWVGVDEETGLNYSCPNCQSETWEYKMIEPLQWVVCGGEYGPKARPMHPDWAKSLRDQCLAAGVKFYFKSWGEWTATGNCENSGYCKQHNISFGENFRMCKVGTKKSGSLLDGVEYKQMPEVER